MTSQIEIQPWDCKPVKFAWPGGYPVYYLAREGWRNDETGELELSQYDRSEFVCCADCAGGKSRRDIILTDSNVNWEDSDLMCDNCSQRIESAYAEKRMRFDSEMIIMAVQRLTDH
jgi:hypothetical protein